MAKTSKNNAVSSSRAKLCLPKLCRACLSPKNLLNMDKIVQMDLPAAPNFTITLSGLYCKALKIPVEDMDGFICQDCLENFKFIYTFLKKCEHNLEILNQYTTSAVPQAEVAKQELVIAPKRRKTTNTKPIESSSDKNSSHLCFLCNQSFSSYQALYKHNKVHRPMRCGGGQECKRCRKKFFSEDTLKRHETMCGNHADDDVGIKDEIVVENSVLIKTEQPEPSDEHNNLELMHFKTEIEDFV